MIYLEMCHVGSTLKYRTMGRAELIRSASSAEDKIGGSAEKDRWIPGIVVDGNTRFKATDSGPRGHTSEPCQRHTANPRIPTMTH